MLLLALLVLLLASPADHLCLPITAALKKYISHLPPGVTHSSVTVRLLVLQYI